MEQTRAALEAVLFQQLRNRLLKQRNSERVDLADRSDDDEVNEYASVSDESEAQSLIAEADSPEGSSNQDQVEETDVLVDLGTVASEAPAWELKTTTATTVTSR